MIEDSDDGSEELALAPMDVDADQVPRAATPPAPGAEPGAVDLTADSPVLALAPVGDAEADDADEVEEVEFHHSAPHARTHDRPIGAPIDIESFAFRGSGSGGGAGTADDPIDDSDEDGGADLRRLLQGSTARKREFEQQQQEAEERKRRERAQAVREREAQLAQLSAASVQDEWRSKNTPAGRSIGGKQAPKAAQSGARGNGGRGGGRGSARPRSVAHGTTRRRGGG